MSAPPSPRGVAGSRQVVVFRDRGDAQDPSLPRMLGSSTPSSTPLSPPGAAISPEVSFHPCTPGTLVPCVWCPLTGCCCYDNSLLRDFAPIQGCRHRGSRADPTLLHSQACLDGRQESGMQESELAWDGGPAQSPAPNVPRQQRPPPCVTWQTPEQLLTKEDCSHCWPQGSDFNYLG